MSAGLISAPLSIALCAALLWALGALVLQSGRKFDGALVAFALAAAGLVLLACETAFGWRGAPHATLSWLYLALALISVAANVLMGRAGRVDGGGFAAALPLAGVSLAFASGDGVRALLAAPLLIYFVAVAVSALRGVEGAPPPDAAEGRMVARPPLRRPPRVRGAREFAIAVIAGALALQSGAVLLPPAPQPEEPAANEASESEAAGTPVTGETAEPAPVDPPPSSSEGEEKSGADAAPDMKKPGPDVAPDVKPMPDPASAAPKTVDTRIYKTQAGNTLRAIAVRLYGRPTMLKALAKANPGVRPDARLPAGREIRLPAPPTRR